MVTVLYTSVSRCSSPQAHNIKRRPFQSKQTRGVAPQYDPGTTWFSLVLSVSLVRLTTESSSRFINTVVIWALAAASFRSARSRISVEHSERTALFWVRQPCTVHHLHLRVQHSSCHDAVAPPSLSRGLRTSKPTAQHTHPIMECTITLLHTSPSKPTPLP